MEISRPDYRTTLWGHGGVLPGFRSALWYAPRGDIVIVVLTNDWRANPQDLAELTLRAVTRHKARSALEPRGGAPLRDPVDRVRYLVQPHRELYGK